MVTWKSPEQELGRYAEMRLGLLFSDWIVNSHDEEDFGFDFEIRPTEIGEDGFFEVSPQNFYVQVKSTEEFEGEEVVSTVLSVDKLIDDYLRVPIPVVLVAYERASDEFYWCIIQEYCWDHLDGEHDRWRSQKYVTIKLKRKPLEKAKNMHILHQKLSSTQEQIAFRKHINSIDSAASKNPRALETGLASSEDVLEYKNRRVDVARLLVNRGLIAKALTELLEVYQMPGEDEAKLKAIVTLLQARQIDHPVIAIAQNRFACEGLELIEKTDRTDVLSLLTEYEEMSYEYIKSEFIGARFFDHEIGQELLVLDVENWNPLQGTPMWVASFQYEDGELSDQSAGAIAPPEYELLETGDSKDPLEQACAEDSHDFGDVATIEEVDLGTKCDNCGLSKIVLYEYTGQALWRSIGSMCADCKTEIPSSAGDGQFSTDCDGRHICSACWSDYNDRFRVLESAIGTMFKICCDSCDDWQGDAIPDSGRCPVCDNQHLMIAPM